MQISIIQARVRIAAVSPLNSCGGLMMQCVTPQIVTKALNLLIFLGSLDMVKKIGIFSKQFFDDVQATL